MANACCGLGDCLNENCRHCGGVLFEVVQGKTTSAEIKRFADGSPVYHYQDLHTGPGGSAVAGVYCSNGCTQDWEDEIGDGAISDFDWEAHEADQKKHTACLYLRIVSIEIEQYKIYVDGYVVGVTRQEASQGLVIDQLEPGEHRVVVREKEVHKDNRIESNTLHFTLQDHGRLTVICTLENGVPVLSI